MDHIPPQSENAEASVLGAILVDNKALNVAREILSPEDFYRTANRKIYAAMLDMEVIDLVTLGDKLKQLGKLEEIGGTFYLTELHGSCPSSARIEQYALLVKEKAVKRDALIRLSDIQGRLYADEAWEEIEEDIGKVSTLRMASKKDRPFSDVLHEICEDVELNHGKPVTGLHTSIEALDEMNAGWQNKTLNIIAGQTSMGKTAFMLQCVAEVAVSRKIPVGIFSLEMSEKKIGVRLLSRVGRIDSHHIRTGSIKQNEEEMQKFTKALAAINEAPIYVDDQLRSVGEICSKAREWKRKYDVRMFCIDYVQNLALPGKDTINNELGHAIVTFYNLAKELDVPILAVSQVHRTNEKGRPNKNQLRDSGTLEQTADMVIFPWRPDVVNDPGKVVLIVDKHRDGPTGDIPLTFLPNIQAFEKGLPENAYPKNNT